MSEAVPSDGLTIAVQGLGERVDTAEPDPRVTVHPQARQVDPYDDSFDHAGPRPQYSKLPTMPHPLMFEENVPCPASFDFS